MIYIIYETWPQLDMTWRCRGRSPILRPQPHVARALGTTLSPPSLKFRRTNPGRDGDEPQKFEKTNDKLPHIISNRSIDTIRQNASRNLRHQEREFDFLCGSGLRQRILDAWKTVKSYGLEAVAASEKRGGSLLMETCTWASRPTLGTIWSA